MKKVKFLHCADIHLDAPFTSVGAGSEKSSIRRQDLKDNFKEIIERAKKEAVDLLLISGDFYEHTYVRKSTISYVNDLFNEISNIKIFITSGNHDPYVKNSFYKNFKWAENVHILSEEEPYVILEDIGVCVYGAGFKNFYEEKSLVYDIIPADPHQINILLVHGTVDMDFKQNIYNPMSSKNLAGLGMDYIALGHFHNRIDDIGGYGMIYNPGTPEPLGFDETGSHGAYIGILSKSDSGEKSLHTDFIELNRRFYENTDVNVSGCNTDEQVIKKIEEAVSLKKEGLYSVSLKGYVEKEFKINTSFICSHFKDTVFYLKIKDETSADYNFDEIMKEPGLRGLFVRKIYSRIDGTKDEYEKKLLLKALYYGIGALDTGKVEIS